MATIDFATPATGVRGIAARHRHAVAAALALALLGCLVLGLWAWSAMHDKHTDGRWELQSGNHGVPAGLIIDVEDREVTGYGPCNPFGARWSQDDGASALVSGAMGCEPTVARQEDEFFRLLLSATTIDVDDDELRLAGDDGALVFSRLE